MRRVFFTVPVLFAFASPAMAQSSAASADPIATSLRLLYEPIKRNLLRAAEQMPEEHFGFQPTPEVRTFGQLIGHVTNTHYNFCSAALGETRTAQENFELRTGKAALLESLRESFTYCDRAYGALSDGSAGESVAMFGTERPRVYALIYNVAHDNEHYGNIVTYMRQKGLVPPSSQRS